MSDNPTTEPNEHTTTAVSPEPTTNPEVAPTQTPEPPAQEAETFDRAYVEQLRKEAATYRTKAKETEEKHTAQYTELETKFNTMLEGLGKLTGQNNTEASPEDQIKAAQAKAAEYEQKIRDMTAQQTLASAIGEFKVDGKPVALDPALTLAVVRGTGALNALDPAAEDYASQVEQVVADAVEAHPQLKTQVVPKSSGNAPTPTENVSGKLTRDQVTALAAEGKWDEINEAAAAGRIA